MVRWRPVIPHFLWIWASNHSRPSSSWSCEIISFSYDLLSYFSRVLWMSVNSAWISRIDLFFIKNKTSLKSNDYEIKEFSWSCHILHFIQVYRAIPNIFYLSYFPHLLSVFLSFNQRLLLFGFCLLSNSLRVILMLRYSTYIINYYPSTQTMINEFT